jgi:ferritin
MEHEINIDVEVTDLVETLDDTIDEAVENFLCNFAERQMSDFMTANGATRRTSMAFQDIENEIMRRAFRIIRTRWERSGN